MSLEHTPTVNENNEAYQETLPLKERVAELNATALRNLDQITTVDGVSFEQQQALKKVHERLAEKIRHLGNTALVALALGATAPSALAQDTINIEQINNTPVASQTFEGKDTQRLETLENSFEHRDAEPLSSQEKDVLYAVTSEPSPTAEKDISQQQQLLTQLEDPTSTTTTSPDTQATSGPLSQVLEKPLQGIDDALAFPGKILGGAPLIGEANKKIEDGANSVREALGDTLGVPVPQESGRNYLGEKANSGVTKLLEQRIPFLKHLNIFKDAISSVDDMIETARSEKSPPEKFNSIMGNITGFAGKLLNERLLGIPKAVLGIAKPFEDKEQKPYDPTAP